MSDSVRPHRWQPTRLCCPWDSPGKNTGVGCPFLLQCMEVKSESQVGQSCPTLCDPMDCSLPGSSAHGIFQARVLEWGCHCLLRESSSSSFLIMYLSFIVAALEVNILRKIISLIFIMTFTDLNLTLHKVSIFLLVLSQYVAWSPGR